MSRSKLGATARRCLLSSGSIWSRRFPRRSEDDFGREGLCFPSDSMIALNQRSMFFFLTESYLDELFA